MAHHVGRILLSKLPPRAAVSTRMTDFKTVIVEGNIASGKTECLKYFQKQYDAKLTAEPIEQWRNCHGHNLLDLMYTDPSRWALTFQTYVQLTMLQAHTSTGALKPGDIKFMERSIYSAKYCFVENLYRNGTMPDVDYRVLTEWFNWIINHSDCNVDMIVYLRTSPDIVYDRLLKRSRPEERRVSLEYLKSLHDLHEDWLIREKFPLTAKVITIDADSDLPELYSQYDKLAKESIFPGVDGRVVLK